MIKRLSHLLVMILVIATLGVSLGSYSAPQTANAQSDEVLARIDDAMAHLSARLGRTITRRSHFWQWSENVWNNDAMDCGVPGVTYPEAVTRAYRVRITVDEVEYDYRVKPDGSVLILCIDGLPDTSSIGIDTSGLGGAPSTGGGTVGIQPLPIGTDWTWIRDYTTDILTLFNPNGIQAQLPRPKLPNEDPNASNNGELSLAISRDGKYLVEAVRLTNSRYGIGIYAFETGQFIQIHEAEENEHARVGSFVGQSAFVSDFASQRIAVGFATFNLGAAGANPWRIIVFDLVTGNAVSEIRNTDPSVVSAVSAWGADYSWVLTNGTTFPIPLYYDTASGGTVHIHFIPWFTEGTPNPPTIAWAVTSNTVTTSPYFGLSSLGINTLTGQPVWARQDPGYAILPAEGPFISYNTIAQGFPGSESNVWVDGTSWHFSPQVANGGAIILFTSSTSTTSRWNALEIATNTSHGLIPEISRVIATPGGFWSMTDTILAFHYPATLNVGSPVFNGSLNNSQFIWASMPNVAFALTQIAIPDTTSPSGGATFCPGAPSSLVASGMRARVTLSDTDPLPLRLRTAPAGEFVQSIPEGTEFTIIGGPQCADNFTWWQVRLDSGITGWSAEGDSSKYFMEPAP